MIDWKEISTAPRDGSWILLSGGTTDDEQDDRRSTTDDCRRPAVAQYTYWRNGRHQTNGRWQFAWHDGGYLGEYLNPTHWAPL